MRSKSFSNRIKRIENLLAGLTAYEDRLAKRGITSEFITKMTQMYDQAIRLAAERKAIKSSAMEATAEMKRIMKQ